MNDLDEANHRPKSYSCKNMVLYIWTLQLPSAYKGSTEVLTVMVENRKTIIEQSKLDISNNRKRQCHSNIFVAQMSLFSFKAMYTIFDWSRKMPVGVPISRTVAPV